MQFILLLLSIVSLNTNTHLPLLTTLLYPSGKQFFLLLTKPQLPTAFISLLLQNFLPHSVALRGRDIQKSHSAKSKLYDGCGSASHPTFFYRMRVHITSKIIFFLSSAFFSIFGFPLVIDIPGII